MRSSGEDAAHRHADWSRVHEGLNRFVEETRSFRGLPGGLSEGTSTTVLRTGERAFLALAGAHLIEPRETGGRFVGGSRGLWLRLPDGGRGEVGGVGGVFVPGSEQPTSIDVGALLVTDRRVLLGGTGENREWMFRNLLTLHHDPDAPWTALTVLNRPAVSGFFYGHADVPLVRFRLSLALAVYTGTVRRLRAELQDALTEHLGRMPPLP